MKRIICSFCLAFSASAQVINIDTFNDGDFTQANTTAQFTYTGTSMLGGERRVTMQDVSSTVSVGSGLLTVNDPFSGFADLFYGATNPADQAKHLHFDASAYPGIVIDVASASSPAQFAVTLFSLENGSQQSSLTIFPVNGPGEYVATYNHGSLNLANLSGVVLTVPGANDSGVFQIDSFGFTTAVPESGLYAIIMGAVCTVFSARHMRRGMLRCGTRRAERPL